MTWLQPIIDQLKNIFQWWIFVLPWEQGIRVRAGKHKKLLVSGWYFKIPFIDSVFIQSTRLRYHNLPMQTLTTKDGTTVTIASSVGYVINNVEKLYESITSPHSTLAAIVCGAISSYVSMHRIEDCGPDKIKEEVTKMLADIDYGLGNVRITLNGYAIVRTYRMLMDQSWFPSDEYKDRN